MSKPQENFEQELGKFMNSPKMKEIIKKRADEIYKNQCEEFRKNNSLYENDIPFVVVCPEKYKASESLRLERGYRRTTNSKIEKAKFVILKAHQSAKGFVIWTAQMIAYDQTFDLKTGEEPDPKIKYFSDSDDRKIGAFHLLLEIILDDPKFWEFPKVKEIIGSELDKIRNSFISMILPEDFIGDECTNPAEHLERLSIELQKFINDHSDEEDIDNLVENIMPPEMREKLYSEFFNDEEYEYQEYLKWVFEDHNDSINQLIEKILKLTEKDKKVGDKVGDGVLTIEDVMEILKNLQIPYVNHTDFPDNVVSKAMVCQKFSDQIKDFVSGKVAPDSFWIGNADLTKLVEEFNNNLQKLSDKKSPIGLEKQQFMEFKNNPGMFDKIFVTVMNFIMEQHKDHDLIIKLIAAISLDGLRSNNSQHGNANLIIGAVLSRNPKIMQAALNRILKEKSKAEIINMKTARHSLSAHTAILLELVGNDQLVLVEAKNYKEMMKLILKTGLARDSLQEYQEAGGDKKFGAGKYQKMAAELEKIKKEIREEEKKSPSEESKKSDPNQYLKAFDRGVEEVMKSQDVRQILNRETMADYKKESADLVSKNLYQREVFPVVVCARAGEVTWDVMRREQEFRKHQELKADNLKFAVLENNSTNPHQNLSAESRGFHWRVNLVAHEKSSQNSEKRLVNPSADDEACGIYSVLQIIMGNPRLQELPMVKKFLIDFEKKDGASKQIGIYQEIRSSFVKNVLDRVFLSAVNKTAYDKKLNRLPEKWQEIIGDIILTSREIEEEVQEEFTVNMKNFEERFDQLNQEQIDDLYNEFFNIPEYRLYLERAVNDLDSTLVRRWAQMVYNLEGEKEGKIGSRSYQLDTDDIIRIFNNLQIDWVYQTAFPDLEASRRSATEKFQDKLLGAIVVAADKGESELWKEQPELSGSITRLSAIYKEHKKRADNEFKNIFSEKNGYETILRAVFSIGFSEVEPGKIILNIDESKKDHLIESLKPLKDMMEIRSNKGQIELIPTYRFNQEALNSYLAEKLNRRAQALDHRLEDISNRKESLSELCANYQIGLSELNDISGFARLVKLADLVLRSEETLEKSEGKKPNFPEQKKEEKEEKDGKEKKEEKKEEEEEEEKEEPEGEDEKEEQEDEELKEALALSIELDKQNQQQTTPNQDVQPLSAGSLDKNGITNTVLH